MKMPSLTSSLSPACEEINIDELEHRLLTVRGERFYLLDARALEDWAYSGLQDDMLEFPESPTVEEMVKSQDPHATLAWTWTNTEARAQREAGSLLAVSHSSKMLETFIDPWANTDGALLLISRYPLQDVADHFGTLRIVGMPDGGEAMLRWSPSKLRGIFEAVSPERRAILMGASDVMVWRENIGPHYRWWWARNLGHPQPRFGGSALYSFTSEELASIQKAGHRHFIETLAHDRLRLRPLDDEKETLAYIKRMVSMLVKLNIHSEIIIREMNYLFPWRAHPLDDTSLITTISNQQKSPEDRLDNLRHEETQERSQQ